MNKHFLLVGAGHAHLTILQHLDNFLFQGHRVTVISPDIHHYYSGMGPGMLSGCYKPEQIRFHVEKMVTDHGGRFVRDLAVHIDPEAQYVQTASGKKISYDIVSFNTGSYVPLDGPPKKNTNKGLFIYPVKPIQNLLKVKKRVTALMKQKRPKILVAGGGAAGVEIAANIHALAERHKNKIDIMMVAGDCVLNQFDDLFRAKAKTMLRNLGIKILERVKVENLLPPRVILSTGPSIHCDLIVWAVGTLPSPIFSDSGIPTGSDGGLLVNENLQSIVFPNIFGGGDCISFQNQELAKVGVYAVRQNPVLFKNLINFSANKPLVSFTPQKDFLVILNMGNGKGLFRWKGYVFQGKMAFQLKDFIDRKFMKKFQIPNNGE